MDVNSLIDELNKITKDKTKTYYNSSIKILVSTYLIAMPNFYQEIYKYCININKNKDNIKTILKYVLNAPENISLISYKNMNYNFIFKFDKIIVTELIDDANKVKMLMYNDIIRDMLLSINTYYDSYYNDMSYSIYYKHYMNVTLLGNAILLAFKDCNYNFIRIAFRNSCVKIRDIIFSNMKTIINFIKYSFRIDIKKSRIIYEWFILINLLIYDNNLINLLSYLPINNYPKTLDGKRWLYKNFTHSINTFVGSHAFSSYDIDYIMSNNVTYMINRYNKYADICIKCSE